MGVDIGIVGLAKSGKTTVFNALTRGSASIEGGEAHVGITKVPDPRLEKLAAIFKPQRIVPAEVKYTDIGASAKVPGKEKGMSSQVLALLSKADAIISVVRAFSAESVPHPEGSVDTERDIAAMNFELAFSDLAIIEKRLERLEDSLNGAKHTERPGFLKEQELLARLKAGLEKGIPLREAQLTAEEAKAVSGYQFLTAKPLLIVVNIGEEQLSKAVSLEAEFASRHTRPKCLLVTLCGKLEMELAELDAAAAQEMQDSYGIKEPGLNLVIGLSYELLGLISFLTVGADEVRAWPIPKSTEAVKAAGKVHTDIERGFIRAEVISYDDLMKCGSLAEAKKKGLLRLEGKSYIVQDGDVINYLFNV
ncbi:MAG: redox-regulated ATPase YchF [Chloroflexi bacterium]|nr:redox-regulated ATPase YchF [Chloroflexota bacterium]